ncbi:MAG: hypothetical protein JAY72_20535 [Candidatus Thiodiazotropha endolucinida]|nr:hypothetical protein [Candidatus Thiodiazotropha taylori]MCW4324070.1 hypothetical protein [Candidatus Thiodiazotropha taylori]
MIEKNQIPIDLNEGTEEINNKEEQVTTSPEGADDNIKAVWGGKLFFADTDYSDCDIDQLKEKIKASSDELLFLLEQKEKQSERLAKLKLNLVRTTNDIEKTKRNVTTLDHVVNASTTNLSNLKKQLKTAKKRESKPGQS